MIILFPDGQKDYARWLSIHKSPFDQNSQKVTIFMQLELKYAAETKALRPPHKYVPWVVVDGEPLYEDYENFISYICKAYKGTHVPKSCSQVFFDSIQMADANRKHSVCDKEAEMPNLWEKLRSTVTSWITQVNMVGAI